MNYKLSKKSLSRLEGVHPALVNVVKRAIELTQVDFAVNEGLRTVERQRELVASKASKTMNSRHLTGHAVDLVAWVGNEPRWDWPLYFQIANAMKQAAHEQNVTITWGGVWDKPTYLYDDPEEEVTMYVERCRLEKSKPFLDGPHFELDRGMYK